MLRNRKRPVNKEIKINKITTEEWEKQCFEFYGYTTSTMHGDVEEEIAGNTIL